MKYWSVPIVTGLAIIISVLILRDTVIHRNAGDDEISVKGLGREDFESDLIVWKSSFEQQHPDLKTAYEILKENKHKAEEFFLKQGLKESDFVFDPVDIYKEYHSEYDQYGRYRQGAFKTYRLTQTVRVESKQVELVEKVSREVSQLIDVGVELNSFPPQYLYTNLADLKLKMIASATEDARRRAETIVDEAGAELGELKDAQLGVFQIIGRNSSEDYSWGGSFNTTDKSKTATVTIRLKYAVD